MPMLPWHATPVLLQFCTPEVGFRIAHVNHVLWLSFPQHYRPFHATTACLNRKANMYLAKWCMKNKVNIMLCFLLYTFIYVEEILRERIKNTEHSSLGVDCTSFCRREHGNQCSSRAVLGDWDEPRQGLFVKVRSLMLTPHVPVISRGTSPDRLHMSEKITIGNFLMKMVNYWAEICHLLIKLNSDFFLQTHAEDKLSISVNHN